MVAFDDDDEEIELRWSEEAHADVKARLRDRLEALAAGDRETFTAVILPTLAAIAAAAADVAALNEWKHADPREGDGLEEVGHVVDSLSATLRWAAWLIGDDIDD